MSDEQDKGAKFPTWVIQIAAGVMVTTFLGFQGWLANSVDGANDRLTSIESMIDTTAKHGAQQLQQTKEERAAQFQLRDGAIDDLRRRVDRLENGRR